MSMPTSTRCACGQALLAAALCLTACVQRPAPTVLRVRPDGSARAEVFVSPYQYEHFILAERAMAMGRPREAAAHYARARAGASDDPLVQARHAEALAAAGRDQAAAAVITQGLSSAPTSEALHLAAARIAERAGDRRAAQARFEAAREALPRSERVAVAYAEFLQRSGEPDHAARELEAFLTVTPDAGAGSLLARLQLAVAAGDGAAAVRAARRYLQATGSQSSDVVSAARAALAANEPGLAASLLAEIPPRAEHLALRVEALVDAGQLGAAESAVALTSPAEVGGAASLARLYLRVQRTDLAVELLASQRPLDVEARRVLAEALILDGDAAAAVHELAGDPSERATALRILALEHAGLTGLAEEVRTHTRGVAGSRPQSSSSRTPSPSPTVSNAARDQ